MAAFKLSEETVNAIVQYLGRRPYAEVATVVKAIEVDARLVKEDEEKEKKGSVQSEGEE